MKTLLRFAALQFLSCAFVTYNFRAIARGDIPNTIASDIAFSLVSFTLLKKIIDGDKSGWAMAGFTIGNILGSVATILVTRWFWGA